MSPVERRAEFMRILISRRKSDIHELARDLDVSPRTIQRDIRVLVSDYPIQSVSGNKGGICLPDWYHPHRGLLSREQKDTLFELLSMANEHQAVILNQLIAEYGSAPVKQK
ncbi:MAG: HTH domain-containing protein [Oscillospiraceae bacterium]